MRSSESPSSMVRPNLPIEWYRPTFTLFTVYLIYSIGMLVGFGYISYWLVNADINPVVKAPALIISLLLASNGFHLLGWFAHDGVHLSLAKNKYVSIILGTLIGGIAGFPTIGYGITHWTHHRFTNQESDPDTRIYSKYTTFWKRFFLSRYVANRGYFKNTFSLIFNRSLGRHYQMPFKYGEVRLFAAASMVFIAVWFSLYAYIATVNLRYAVIAILIPYVLTIPITGLRIYIEHTGTGAGIFRDTRTYSSPLYTALLFGNNFHLEHHIYPRVPAYNLPKVHKFLLDGGYLKKWGCFVVPGVLEPLKYATGAYQYPTPQLDDLSEDPFDINNRPEIAA
jgi:beta-carotene hydroxylase